MGNVRYEAGVTAETVTQLQETVSFQHPFEAVPAFFGNIATHNGWDSSQLRQASVPGALTATSASFVIEEENCVDDETGCDGEVTAGNGCHPNGESIAWLAMSPLAGVGGTAGHAAGYQNQANQGNVAGVMMGKPYPLWHTNMGEVGTATVTTAWTLVVVNGQYRNPQVFCGVPSRNGGDAVACRITGKRHTIAGTIYVSGNHQDDAGGAGGFQTTAQMPFRCADGDDRDAWCFYVALQEPSCLDQWHAEETVSWTIMEEGSWMSDDAKQIQVGHVSVGSQGWTWVPYLGTGFANSPVTITQIQTFHGLWCNNHLAGTNTIDPNGPNCDHGLNHAINDNNDVPYVHKQSTAQLDVLFLRNCL